jgi:hypothetical protein
MSDGEELMTRRIVREPDFVKALRALECASTELMVGRLAELLASRPHWAPAIADSPLRMLHTGPYAEFPALRIYYRFDEYTLYLEHIEVYDPLGPQCY